MFMYAIVLNDSNDAVTKRIGAACPRHYKLNDTTFLVRNDKISEGVAVDIGLRGLTETMVDGALGAVLKPNDTYSGYATTSLWEWLSVEE